MSSYDIQNRYQQWNTNARPEVEQQRHQNQNQYSRQYPAPQSAAQADDHFIDNPLQRYRYPHSGSSSPVEASFCDKLCAHLKDFIALALVASFLAFSGYICYYLISSY